MLDFRKLIWIFVGSLCMAMGIHFFLMPHLILDGGLIGVALLLNYLWGFRVGLVMFCCSLICMAIVIKHHRLMVFDSLLGLCISSCVIDLLAPWQFFFTYYVNLSACTSAILGGLLLGLGFGFLLQCDTTTGGIDLVAHVLAKKINWNTGVILVAIDLLIVSFGALFISMETFFYSLVTVCTGGFATSMWMTWRLRAR